MEIIKIGKWGNSLAIRISSAIKSRHGLERDQDIQVIEVAGGIFLKPLSQSPKGMLTVWDHYTKEIVTFDPARINRITLSIVIENGKKNVILKIKTSVVMVTVGMKQLIDQEAYINEVINLPNNNPLTMAVDATQSVLNRAGGMDTLELWSQANITWTENSNPLNDGEFMTALINMKNKLKII